MMRILRRFSDRSSETPSRESSEPLPNLCPDGPFIRPFVAAAPLVRPPELSTDLQPIRPTAARVELPTVAADDPPDDLPKAQNAHEHLRVALDHIAALEVQLKAKSDALGESRTEVATAAVTYHRVELQLEEKNRELQAVSETLVATKALFDTAVKSCAELSAQVHNLEGTLNEKAKTIESLQVEIEDLKAASAVAKEQDNQLAAAHRKAEQKYRAELAARTAQLEIQLNQKKTEFLEQHLKFAALQSELASKNAEIKLAQLEIERLQGLSASGQEADVKAAAAVAAAQQALRTEFDRQRVALEEQIAQQGRQIDEEGAKIMALSSELDGKKQELVAATQQLTLAQRASAESLAETSGLRQIVAELEEKGRSALAERSAQFEEQLKQKDAEVAELVLSISGLQAELLAAQKENARYSTDTVSAEQTRRAELDALRAHYESQIDVSTAELDALTSKVEELEAVNKLLQEHNHQFVETAFANARKYADEEIAVKDAVIARLETELGYERPRNSREHGVSGASQNEVMTLLPRSSAPPVLNSATGDDRPFCSDVAA